MALPFGRGGRGVRYVVGGIIRAVATCSNCAAVDKQSDIEAISGRSQSFATIGEQVLRSLRRVKGGRIDSSSWKLTTQVAAVHDSTLKTTRAPRRFESNCESMERP